MTYNAFQVGTRETEREGEGAEEGPTVRRTKTKLHLAHI